MAASGESDGCPELKAAIVVLVVAALVVAALLPSRLRRRRRQRLFRAPLPGEHRRILERNLPLYRRMPPELREQLGGHVNVFLAEKRFLGCGGLEVTEEMRVTIAGHACLLLLNREPRYFPGFTSIFVYPDTFLVDQVEYDGEIEIEGQDARAGESWEGGPVILSWSDILPSISEPDGQNVILHEFAHKLDEENPDVEGLPVLDSVEHYREWKEVFSRAWENLEDTLDSLDDPAIDDYALTSPAEFFAVATEAFFESPVRMRRQFPEVYAQLAKLYRVDPASWGPAEPLVRHPSRARALERR
jgi:Mlc titration factor MtfA (ptsG expression regulator)